ncbi:MAG: thioredoxin family protein [Bacilli bacterium]
MNYKKIVSGVLILIFAITLSGCAEIPKPCIETNNKFVCDSEVANMNGYDGYTNDQKIFVKRDISTTIDALTSLKDGIYYLGYEDCPWCVEAVPLMAEAAAKNNRKIIYLNIKDEEITDEQSSAIKKTLDSTLDKDENGVKTLYVPEVVVIESGSIKSFHIGTLDSHQATERKMSKGESNSLLKIYLKMFR